MIVKSYLLSDRSYICNYDNIRYRQKKCYRLFSKKSISTYALTSGVYDIVKKYHFAKYSASCVSIGSGSFNDSSIEYLNIDFNSIDNHLVNVSENLYSSYRKRIQRLKSRVANLLFKPCVFLTFTFTDECLSKLNKLTRRRYVQRALKSYNAPYVANIDFGSNNEREHYHAILQVEKFNHTSWSCGAVSFKRVVVNNTSALSKYIVKLTNHALKDGTRCCDRLLYSR